MKFPPFFLSQLAVVGITVLGASQVLAASAEWPQFRGPTGDGVSEAKNLPLLWSAEKGQAWSVEIPGKGWSSPVLANGRIYVTSAIADAADEISLNALCLDQATGAVVWNQEVFRPDAGQIKAMHRKNTAASPTPIVSEGRIFVHFGHMGTAALDPDGKVLWKQESLRYKPVHGTGGSPALIDGLLVFSGDGAEAPFLAALDARSGEVRWKTPRSGSARKNFSFSTPTPIRVQEALQIISPGSGYVAGYKPSDGSELWRVNYGEGYSVVPRPVYAGGLLFLSSGFDAATLYAIRPEGAAGDVTTTHVAWTIKKGAPHTPSVAVAEGLLFFVSDAGIASCVETKTGELRWTERLSGNFSASPIVAEGRVYFQNETGSTFVVKVAPTFELLATNELGERTLASPAASDGALFIRGESHLFKLRP